MTNPFEELLTRLQTLEGSVGRIEQLLHKPAQPEDDLLTLDRVAAMLNVSEPTVYGYVHFRQIPYMKRRGRLYFSKKEIMAWLEETRRSTKKEITANI